MSTTRRPLGTGPKHLPPASDAAAPRPGTAAERAAEQLLPTAVDHQVVPRAGRRPLGSGPDRPS
ncbi:hypothetical protein SUDANB105_08116 (plasmid) [Streptomyces sp. enrichment culture]|uniref:hypothetical protein n=1 Tax=Streptomyces sp. enrichment culture TaxID=1795815 RepID=UPI003F54D377